MCKFLLLLLALAASLPAQVNPIAARRIIWGTALPASCQVADVFFLTTATAGRNIYGCTAPNTWTLEGDGGAGGGGTDLAKQSFAQGATTATITHNWALADPQKTMVYCALDGSPDQQMLTNSADPSANSVTITFAAAATAGYCLANGSASGATGMQSLNGDSSASQTFATPGTSGTAPNWVTAASVHTLHIPLASTASVTRGLISKTDYDSFAAKLTDPMTTRGDLIFRNSSNTTARLPVGAANRVLRSDGTDPSWAQIVLATDLAAASSADLASVLNDDVGTSGGFMRSGSPTITTPTISGAITFPDGVRQTFNPDGTAAGLNVGSHSADPSSPTDGDLVYNSTTAALRARIGGAWVSLGAGTTPHASTHQHGGADEVATATAGANAIPKAQAGGTLALGWIPSISSADLRSKLTDENGTGAALFESAANPTLLDLTIDDLLTFAESAGDATCGAGDYWIKGNSTSNKLRGCENGSTFDVNTVAGASSWSSLSAPTAATNFVSDATGETVDFQFQSAFTSGNQFAIRQNTGNPSGGTLFAVIATDTDPVLSLFQRPVDGAAVLLTIENSQANAASSTNETADIRALFAGVEAGFIRFGKTEDYTSGANESSFLAIHTRTDGTTAEAARFLLNGVLDLVTGLRIGGSATNGRYLRANGTNFVVSGGAASGTGSCTNQAVRVLNDDAAPTCVTITSSYVDSSIGLTGSPLSQFAATTSAQLAGVIPDETGSGALVFGTSPTLAGTPVIGDGSGNDKLSFAAESTNPACSAGNYFIWANSGDASLKKCQNGTISNLDTGASGLEVTAAATFANDNRLLRSDGPDRGAQASGVTVDDSNNMTVPGNLTVNGTLEVGDGTVAGEAIMRELTANGTEYRSWLVPDALTAILRLRFANGVNTAGQVMRFGTPSSNIADQFWSDASGVGACTNQVVRVLNNDAAPTCVTITSSYVDSSIGLTGSALSQFASTTSAQLAGVLSDETGSGGGFVRATSPTISGPAITGNATFSDYNDWTEIAAPGNPAAGTVRVYAKSASGELCSKSSGGTETCMSAGAGGGNHNLLSSTHSDTATGTVVRGDIVVGNSTPAWSRRAIGANLTVLASDGTDPAWTSLTASHLPVRTRRFSLLNGSVLPINANSDVYFEPYTILATGGVWEHGLWRFGVSNSAQPTVRSCISGHFTLPSDVAGTVSTANALVVWTGTGTSGNVVWDFDYRIVGGDDTTSLNQAGTQEAVTVTDAMPGAAHRRLVASMALTASNFSGQANNSLTWKTCRDGVDAADTAAFSALMKDVMLEVSTQ